MTTLWALWNQTSFHRWNESTNFMIDLHAFLHTASSIQHIWALEDKINLNTEQLHGILLFRFVEIYATFDRNRLFHLISFPLPIRVYTNQTNWSAAREKSFIQTSMISSYVNKMKWATEFVRRRSFVCETRTHGAGFIHSMSIEDFVNIFIVDFWHSWGTRGALARMPYILFLLLLWKLDSAIEENSF